MFRWLESWLRWPRVPASDAVDAELHRWPADVHVVTRVSGASPGVLYAGNDANAAGALFAAIRERRELGVVEWTVNGQFRAQHDGGSH